MRRPLLLAAAIALIAATAPLARTQTNTLSLVAIEVSTRAEAAYVAANFDETHRYLPGFVEVVLHPGDAERLRDLGYSYDVITPDLVKAENARRAAAPRAAAVALPGPDRSDYRVLADYVTEMKDLAKKNPGVVKLLTLPNKTLEGRTVHGLEIALDVNATDGRPTLYIDGIHHAREWPAGEYPMIYAHHLVESLRGGDPQIRDLLRRLRFVIVPVVNVDGFDFARSSLVDARGVAGTPLAIAGVEAYWRKNRRSVTGVTTKVPGVMQRNLDAYGTDPNRNYGYKWGDNQGGSSSEHAGQTYRGTAPFSEPETQNVRSVLLGRHATGVLSNHTYSRLVLRPWGDTDEPSPDELLLERIGEGMAEAMGGYRNILGIQLYLTTGTLNDWAYGTSGSLAYVLEHGTEFHPVYGDGPGEEYPGVVAAFTQMATAAADPRHHSVISGRVVDRGGRPVQAQVSAVKRFDNPLWPDNPSGKETAPHVINTLTRTGANGAFVWHVNPSTRPAVQAAGRTEAYTVTISAPGLRPVTKRVVVRRGQRVDLGTIRLG
ncbi:MAG TPA: M14 family zinc carboxypeptidase [Mycobacteriales bacterium]|nr:M14 family zinc carboxypeptidase [Mycobacteriales bacterium]